MPENIKVYKFLFRAHITTFDLKANISSPLIVTWKRSSQTSSTQAVEMVSGKADINQTLTLPVSMYFDLNEQKFQQKKSQFSFTMRSPKGEKQAGVVYVNLAQQVNDKMQTLQSTFTLQKCPVKNSQVHISISAQCIGEKDQDGMSHNSFFIPQTNPSILQLEPHHVQNGNSKVKQPKSEAVIKKQVNNISVNPSSARSAQIDQRDNKIRELQDMVASLKDENKKLKTELVTQKEMTKKLSSGSEGGLINSLREQLLKGKTIQSKLETDIESYRQENLQHQRELQTIRQKMDRIYQTFCKQFDIQQQQL